jgi:hypothetical protein
LNNSSSGTSQIAAAADQVVESLRNFLHTESAQCAVRLRPERSDFANTLEEMSGLKNGEGFCPVLPQCPLSGQ